MFLALEVPATVDLTDYSRLLWQRRISHQIGEQNGMQYIAVAENEQVPQARELFEQWRLGQVKPMEQDSTALSGYLSRDRLQTEFFRALVRAPLTVLLIIASCVLLILAPLARPTTLTFALVFPDFSYGTGLIVLSRVWEGFSFGQFLRMLTPILLHGGLLHLVFNMSWLWELGRRIERHQTTLALAMAIGVIALFSNTSQYLWGGGNNFGGMSGVVYGLFAYIWMWQLFDPRQGLNLPGSLILFMLASLAIFTYLGLSMIANAAHMGGFLSGVVYGALTGTISRIRRGLRGPTT